MTEPTDLLVNPFRERLKQPGVPLGTWLMSGASSTAEAMGRAGFDWLLLDLERCFLALRIYLRGHGH
jgi:2-keto-3-deoxy-L-rhamnonate aldolase RhmA